MIHRLTLWCTAAVTCLVTPSFGETVTFEGLLASPETYYRGDVSQSNTDPWVVGSVEFSNRVDLYPGFDPAWSGWAYSNTTDSTTADFSNQYSAAPGGGSDGLGGADTGGTYALAFGSGAWFNLPTGARLQTIDWTNGTYPLMSMRFGDAFSKKFGGPGGDDPDFFRVTLTGNAGRDGAGPVTGSVVLDLADFTSPDAAQDYIVDSWRVGEDMTALGDAQSVTLSFASSDTGMFGINTPTYFFMDNLTYSVTAIPEPSTVVSLALLATPFVLRRRRV